MNADAEQKGATTQRGFMGTRRFWIHTPVPHWNSSWCMNSWGIIGGGSNVSRNKIEAEKDIYKRSFYNVAKDVSECQHNMRK